MESRMEWKAPDRNRNRHFMMATALFSLKRERERISDPC